MKKLEDRYILQPFLVLCIVLAYLGKGSRHIKRSFLR